MPRRARLSVFAGFDGFLNDLPSPNGIATMFPPKA